jgi:hypothetical protein
MRLAPSSLAAVSVEMSGSVSSAAVDTATSSSARVWRKEAHRPLRSYRMTLGIWGVAQLLGVHLPWAVIRQTNGAALLAWEAQRLQALAESGEVVPKILSHTKDVLEISDLGPTLDHVLSEIPSGTDQLCLMCAASADLAKFHGRGHWHGGSQIRNLTWNGQWFGRIDFEEALHPALPLITVQAYDLLQLLLSMVHWLQPLGGGAVDAVLLHYAQAASNHAQTLRQELRTWLPRLHRLQGFLGWRQRWRRSREYQRLTIVIEALDRFAGKAAPRA